MVSALVTAFTLGGEDARCWACGSPEPPRPSEPPPPMAAPFALFFLMIGCIVLTTVSVDPTGASLELSAPTSPGPGRDILGSLSLGVSFLTIGVTLLGLTLKRSMRAQVRWICRRCGALWRGQ